VTKEHGVKRKYISNSCFYTNLYKSNSYDLIGLHSAKLKSSICGIPELASITNAGRTRDETTNKNDEDTQVIFIYYFPPFEERDFKVY
jgi:hypothetical protein